MKHNKIIIRKVKKKKEIDIAFSIRHKVFVVEQKVPENEDKDGFDDAAHHYLACWCGRPVGTGRWRACSEGIKVERIAVLKQFRKKGIGRKIVKRILKDIRSYSDATIFLHSQENVVRFYEEFGFIKISDIFPESNILHYKMALFPRL